MERGWKSSQVPQRHLCLPSCIPLIYHEKYSPGSPWSKENEQTQGVEVSPALLLESKVTPQKLGADNLTSVCYDQSPLGLPADLSRRTYACDSKPLRLGLVVTQYTVAAADSYSYGLKPPTLLPSAWECFSLKRWDIA